jgi:hypothetical protein
MAMLMKLTAGWVLKDEQESWGGRAMWSQCGTCSSCGNSSTLCNDHALRYYVFNVLHKDMHSTNM